MDAKFLFVLCLMLGASRLFEARKKVILLLIDGVRWDYINDPKLKGIPRMIQNGVRAPYVYPIYPSVSYPNWYTIVTGLYAQSHGFVHNEMYDPKLKRFFYPNKTDLTSLGPEWWEEAEPIWITAEKNNSNAAMYWWSGCEMDINGKHPMICERHRYGPGTDDDKEDFFNRIEDMVGLFRTGRSSKDGGLSLALMYYGSLDNNGHQYGPDSKEVKKSLYVIDEVLDKMQSKLKKAGLENEVNIMVVSDHGMTKLSDKDTKYIDLDKFTSSIKVQITSGTSSMIIPEEGMLDKLYNDMKHENMTGVKVYKREELPDNYNLKGNDRVPPLLVLADHGFQIKPISDANKRLGKPFSKKKGDHGYDPYQVEDMRTIFIATGPDFRKKFTTPEPLHNVDFYNVMCQIIGINPLPNNGSWDRVTPMLVKDGHPEPKISKGNIFSGNYKIILCACILVIASLFY